MKVLNNRYSIVKRYISLINGEWHGVFPSIISTSLFLFSCVYRVALELRAFLYRLGLIKRTTFPVPVISVGNITMGGTGKTPVVEYIAIYLRNRGKRVAILSRGYRSKTVPNITDNIHNPKGHRLYNDESLMLHENLVDIPNILGKDRVASGQRALIEYKTDCLILDDGFQHLRLNRSLDIVVINSLNPFGQGRIIPNGSLREPLKGLKRADLFIISHCNLCPPEELKALKNRLVQMHCAAHIVETTHHPIHLENLMDSALLPVEWLSGRRIYAFCGIGSPESFSRSLLRLGTYLVKLIPFPDHHFYQEDELDAIIKEATYLKADAIVTTQKDKAKILEAITTRIFETCDAPIFSMKVVIRLVKGKEYLEELIDKALSKALN